MRLVYLNPAQLRLLTWYAARYRIRLRSHPDDRQFRSYRLPFTVGGVRQIFFL